MVPSVGDKLTWLNLDIEIMDMEGVRIDQVLLTVK
jgi:CBS domain containing-hemolysin-like protein